jgi:hypothetical protein
MPVDPRFSELVKHPDREKRKAAIQALARTKDRDAIAYLEHIEDFDTDAELRDLAKKAITYIDRNSPDNFKPVMEQDEKPHASPVIHETRSSTPDALPVNPLSVERTVSPREEKLARTTLESAVGYNLQGKKLLAAKAIVQAFKINPTLARDSYALGIIRDLTQDYSNEAIEMAKNGTLVDLYDPKKQKRGGGAGAGGSGGSGGTDGGAPAEEDKHYTVGGALLDLVIYGLVNGVLLGVTVFLLVYAIFTSLPPDALAQQLAPGANLSIGDLATLFTSIGTTLIIIYALLYAVIQMVTLLLQCVAFHWVATTFFNGDGALSEQIHRIANFYIILTPILFIVQIASGLVPAYLLGAGSIDFETANTLNTVLTGLTLALSIYLIWGTSTRIGKTYRFGAGNGCLTMLVGSIALAVGCCLLTLGLSYTVGAGLEGLLPASGLSA